MKPPHYASLVADLARSRDETWVPPPGVRTRERAIEAIAAAMTASKRRRRARWVMIGTAAAAAAMMVTWGARRWWVHPTQTPVANSPSSSQTSTSEHQPGSYVGIAISGSPVASRSGEPIVLGQGASLRDGDRIVADRSGRAALTLSTGTQLFVEGGARLGIVSQGEHQVFSLEEGTVSASVAKLASNERFVVRTQDAEVEVRGTKFQV